MDKVTIIVPTRERADTLYHCLRTVTEQDYENLSILVSDNFSGDSTREVVSAIRDPRLIYVNTGQRLSMSHNWEFALSHVTDGWVGYLGDDDGLLPGAITRLSEVITESGVDAIASKWKFYYWPGSTSQENDLTVPLGTGHEVRDSRKWLAKLMKGEADYPDLPHIYTGGFAKLSLINASRDHTGRFFCSMIPDLYSAVALASASSRYAMIHEPISIMGVSSHSNGASSFGIGKSRRPAEQFFSEKNIPFHDKLGSDKVRSIRLLIYECYLQSVHLHHDSLGVDMLEQLELAMHLSDYDPELVEYCREVAIKNGLDWNARKKLLTRYKVSKARLLTNIKTVLGRWDYVTLDALKYHASNVYDAAHVAHTVYQFSAHDKYWHRKKTVEFSHWLLSKFVRTITRKKKPRPS